MILDHIKIKTVFRNKYKNLTEIFILDPVVVCPSLAQITFVVDSVRKQMQDLKFEDAKMDCDDFALIMNAKVHLFRYKEKMINQAEYPYQYCFGEVFVEKQLLLGGTGYHMMNCFVDDKTKLYFVEPQNGKIILQGSKDDPVKEVLHVRI